MTHEEHFLFVPKSAIQIHHYIIIREMKVIFIYIEIYSVLIPYFVLLISDLNLQYEKT